MEYFCALLLSLFALGNGLCLVYATSAGDIYGQRLAVCRTDGEREHHDEEPTVASIHRNPLIARRIQSM